MDSSHYHLNIHFGAHRLEADCYAPQEYSEIFPEVRSLRTFAQLTKAVLAGTTMVEHGSGPNPAMQRTPDRSLSTFCDDFRTSTASDARPRSPSLILFPLDA